MAALLPLVERLPLGPAPGTRPPPRPGPAAAAVPARRCRRCSRWRLQNTAFQDESLYLYAGHREIAQLLHHTPTYDNYASYFSGAPFLYPVLGAAADHLAGLAGARALSLLFMLATTAMLHGLSRRLFGRPAALLAAARCSR